MASLSLLLLLPPLQLIIYSSPAVLSAVTVTHLPGFTGALPFHLETGYVSVDEVNGVELFYYFLQSEKNPREDPLILWLTGGPGCSAFSGLVFEIGIEAGDHPPLNLKGYLIGNPTTGELVDMNSRVPYAHGVGIISDELYEMIQRNCEGEDYGNPNPLNLLCFSALDKFDMFVSEINPAYTLDPSCPLVSPRRKQMNRDRSLQEKYVEFMLPPVVPDLKCRSYSYFLSYYWANDYNTREALHIKKGTVKEWVRCNKTLAYTINVPSSIIYHLNLTKKGYRALVYSGDKDLLVPFIGTQAWIRSLNYSIVDDWRSWRMDGQVAGYTRMYSNNLTFATVKDAGHTAPEYMPKSCQIMLDRWISHKPL